MSFEEIVDDTRRTLADHNSSPWPSWIANGYNFSLFRSISHPVATEQVSAQIDQRFGKRC